LYASVCCSFVHNSQNAGAVPSLDEWINVYQSSGILFSLKKDWSSDSCYDMDECWGRFATWNKPWISISKIDKYTEVDWELPRALRSYCLVVTEFLCGMMKTFWKWWWWLYNNVNVINASELYTLKWVKSHIL
jgi:hypothetical protein